MGVGVLDVEDDLDEWEKCLALVVFSQVITSLELDFVGTWSDLSIVGLDWGQFLIPVGDSAVVIGGGSGNFLDTNATKLVKSALDSSSWLANNSVQNVAGNNVSTHLC